ncbi:citrate lyase subunit beta/citryl-CoA lyase [Amycolatopsis bartoniae]|uniref:Citryl-CoA lyase n=2 Tax=Amycolatopsis bartoniae TaxID=941986 RepID=A0A8H9J0H0_9PSEU|nr:CoA ester lyase [Amycolatopsis bartoniae]MBB2938684.1 citrate lyase subunit beta/citryl-CoA lyase [Amycolatopsis bartoniae]TVT11626.1 CoA ester lyase [Amycolatopsis bartoniae]GHF79407.1 citryl-CoA lyase [Amycolatopsis bartoniae]
MASYAELVAHSRSLLFVPGHRPDRFAKAAGSGADVVVLDIEDAVGPESKPAAREHIDAWLAGGGRGVVRVNAAGTPWYDEDLAMLAEHPDVVIMLPKVTAPHQIAEALSRLASDARVLPLVETAAGVLAVDSLLAVPGVLRAVFGNADLGTEIGVAPEERTAFAYPRSRMVMASAALRLPPPIDGVTIRLRSVEAITDDARHALSMGFSGKLCLHPSQVPVVNQIFSPSEYELEWAREVLDAAADGSIQQLRGQVVGKPMLERARRLLKFAS